MPEKSLEISRLILEFVTFLSQHLSTFDTKIAEMIAGQGFTTATNLSPVLTNLSHKPFRSHYQGHVLAFHTIAAADSKSYSTVFHNFRNYVRNRGNTSQSWISTILTVMGFSVYFGSFGKWTAQK